jgi:hypothetical protein
VLQDQGRINAAAALVDAVFQRCLAQGSPSAHTAARHLRAMGVQVSSPTLASLGAGGGSSWGGSVQPAAAAAAGGGGGLGPNKRPRLAAGGRGGSNASSREPSPLALGLLQQQPQQRHGAAGAGVLDDDAGDVIEAFLSAGADAGSVGPANTRVRCVCAQHVPREPMLQCAGTFCGVWQHAGCVVQRLAAAAGAAGGGGGVGAAREAFYCERCRLSRADPFWELFDVLLMAPAVGKPTGAVTAVSVGGGPVQQVPVCSTGTRTLLLSRTHMQLLQEQREYQLQVGVVAWVTGAVCLWRAQAGG